MKRGRHIFRGWRRGAPAALVFVCALLPGCASRFVAPAPPAVEMQRGDPFSWYHPPPGPQFPPHADADLSAELSAQVQAAATVGDNQKVGDLAAANPTMAPEIALAAVKANPEKGVVIAKVVTGAVPCRAAAIVGKVLPSIQPAGGDGWNELLGLVMTATFTSNLRAQVESAAAEGDYAVLGFLAKMNPDLAASMAAAAVTEVQSDVSKIQFCEKAIVYAVPIRAGEIGSAAMNAVPTQSAAIVSAALIAASMNLPLSPTAVQ